MSAEPGIHIAPAHGHLQLLEAESIHILREVAAESERPVLLYSICKDSSVMRITTVGSVDDGKFNVSAAAHTVLRTFRDAGILA